MSRATPLRPSDRLAIAEARRLYPSTRYAVVYADTRGNGCVEVRDVKTNERMVTVYGSSTDEERGE